MVEDKNQHYVPQFYFRLFSNDGKNISIFNINNKKHFIGPFKKQSSKDYFYFKGKELEEAFGRLETSQKEAINKLITLKSFKKISKEEYIEILRFITFQNTRTNYAKRAANETTQYLVREYVKPKMLQDKNLTKEIEKEEIEKVDITFPADHLISINCGIQAPILISDLIPTLLVNKTDSEFIFSDNPIIFYNLFFHKDTFHSHIGFQSPGLIIFCPISKDLCLLLYDSKFYNVGEIKENLLEINNFKDIENINKLQLHRCDKNIYYTNPNKKEEIDKLFNEFSKKNKKNESITKLEKLKIINKPNSEVLMMGERNINEKIDFSFLRIKDFEGEVGRIRKQELVNVFNAFLKKDKE